MALSTDLPRPHGAGASANPRIKLQEEIDRGLAPYRPHITKREPNRFVELVLDEYGRRNEARLEHESILLASGTTGISDTNLPAGYVATVIREALSDLNVLQLVQALTDFASGPMVNIPYELRDATAVHNGGVVYEGNAVHRANISQDMDPAYVVPMKLAFLISNELIHFSRASGIAWDAYARSVDSNARFIREMLAARIANEMQRAADAYGAVSVTGETFDSQLDGSTHTIKTAQFPLVAPFQTRDIKGTAIGSVENSITVTLNGTALDPYDGTGTQTAGTYCRVTSHNLGYIQFVDEAGDPVTPTDTGTDTLAYDFATNVTKFDLDPGSVDLDFHLNGLLRGIGARKAVLADDRFVPADFLLMSGTLNDTCTNARQFEAGSVKSGTGLGGGGDLQTIKGVPAWSTNVVGSHLGDERILMGPFGVCSYVVAKPWETGAPFEMMNANGYPTGQKQAYGEEYSVIKVPAPIRGRLTSVLAYSATGR